jgi:hypothetical protein
VCTGYLSGYSIHTHYAHMVGLAYTSYINTHCLTGELCENAGIYIRVGRTESRIWSRHILLNSIYTAAHTELCICEHSIYFRIFQLHTRVYMHSFLTRELYLCYVVSLMKRARILILYVSIIRVSSSDPVT